MMENQSTGTTEDSIKDKGETLIWTDGSVWAYENKKITIEAVFYNKRSTRNRTFIIKGRLKISYITECIAIEEAITSAPRNKNIRIIIGSKSLSKHSKWQEWKSEA